jgi:uncharacterized protein YndB with AHSA1/START domain
MVAMFDLDSEELRPRSTTITRLVYGQREVVWRMWTDSTHLAAWWGPHGFTNPECSIDPRPGGVLRILMRSSEGEEFLNVGTVQSVEEPERLVFTISLLGGDGRARLTNHTTVEFEDRGPETKVTVRVQAELILPEARGSVEGMQEGWFESLGRLSRAIEDGALR